MNTYPIHRDLFLNTLIVEMLIHEFVPQFGSDTLDFSTLQYEPDVLDTEEGHGLDQAENGEIYFDENNGLDEASAPHTSCAPNSGENYGFYPRESSQLETPQDEELTDFLEYRDKTLIFSSNFLHQKSKSYKDWMCFLIRLQPQREYGTAMQVLESVSRFYLQLEHEGRFSGEEEKLPGILGIIFYSGEEPWTDPTDVRQYFKIPPGTWMEPYLAKMRILLIDIHRVDDARLEKMQNPVGWLMQIEKTSSKERVLSILDKVQSWARHAHQPFIWKAFESLLDQVQDLQKNHLS